MNTPSSVVRHARRGPRDVARVQIATACLAGALAACTSGDGAPPPSGDNLRVSVAPLELVDIGEAVWRITVDSSASRVWTQEVSSTSYGDGRGAVTYVGPCDASANPHTVTLELLELRDGGLGLLSSPSDFKNPGPIAHPGITCKPNADVLVPFDLTLVRAARQGFFDVAVSFDDIFCSAKLDCQSELLHDASGERSATAVMAFACTTGAGSPTWLYLSDARLTCVDAAPTDGVDLPTLTTTLSLATAGPGQQGARPPLVYQWARYSGREAFADVDKCYWNHAFGLDLGAIGARRCTLEASGTAGASPLSDGAPDPLAVWPEIRWSVEVVGANGALCGPHPLDGDPVGVVTGYRLPTADGLPGPSFAAALSCDDVAVAPIGTACAGTAATTFRATSVGGRPAVAITVAGVAANTAYELPEGATLGSACCLDACCGD